MPTFVHIPISVCMQVAYLQTPIIAQPNRVLVYAKAAIALHNYLRTTESSVYCPLGFVHEKMVKGIQSMGDGGQTKILVQACYLYPKQAVTGIN